MATTTKSAFDIQRLRKAIQTALMLPDDVVIGGWLPENVKRPYFITVDEMNQAEIGQSRRVFDEVREIETITTSLLSTISISCYGNNSIKMATKIKSLLQGSILIDALHAMNASIVSFSDVRNLTATVGAEFEERGQFDFTLSHHYIVETDLRRVEQIDISQSISVEIRPKN